MKTSNALKTLEQYVNFFFTGISIHNDQPQGVTGEYIYFIYSDNRFQWFTSHLNRGDQQINGINSFLRLNSETFEKADILNISLPEIVYRFRYELEQNAICKFSRSIKLCPRTSIAFQLASNKQLIAIIPPRKVGQVIKVSKLKQNLSNEIAALQNIDPKIIVPKPLGHLELNNNYSSSAQTVLRGMPVHNEISDKKIAIVLNNLTNKRIALTSIREQSEAILDNLKQKNLTNNQKKCIESLLMRNKNKTSINSSRTHGDLRPANMKICSSQEGSKNSTQLGLLDWEFSNPIGIGATDFLRWKMDLAYAKSTSFEELFTLSNITAIRKLLSELDIVGNTLPFNELIRLHVAIHATDRLHSFWTNEKSNLKLNNLQRILNSKWPNNLD